MAGLSTEEPLRFPLLIEQAIFTSAETDRLSGYHVVAHSAGVLEEDLREIAAWAPSHDSLLDDDQDAASVNFHPLPSGAFCVSKSTAAGGEHSGRAGPRIYTQCLVAPAEALARFANNPFALLTAAFAQGSLKTHDEIPTCLDAFRLAGRATPFDQGLPSRFLTAPGAEWLEPLLEAALSTVPLAIVSREHRQRAVAMLLNCLPVECRPWISFSTGLKYSPSRPFRVFGATPDSDEAKRVLRRFGVTILDFDRRPPLDWTEREGWGAFIARAIAGGKSFALGAQFAKSRPGLALVDLPALARRLNDEMSARVGPGTGLPSRPAGASRPEDDRDGLAVAPWSGEVRWDATESPSNRAELALARADLADVAPTEGKIRADAPHRRFDGSKLAVDADRHASEAALSEAALIAPDFTLDPSRTLSADHPEILERLELLDDTVFEAIAGKPEAMARLKTLWPKTLAELGSEMVEASREQYTRHALKVWRDCVAGENIRDPAPAILALEVVCLLFDS